MSGGASHTVHAGRAEAPGPLPCAGRRPSAVAARACGDWLAPVV